MANTPHLGITLLEQSQAQKEITVNEAFQRIDALLNSGVVDRDLATPPSSPAAGSVYIVGAGATGDWSGKVGQIAYFDQVWRFIVPRTGICLWLIDENTQIVYDGAAWQLVSSSGGGSAVSPLACEGRLTLTSNVPVTTADVTAATSVYFTPYRGNRIALYDGSAWQLLTFSQITLAVPSTTTTLYDVFAYSVGTTVTLETVAWTNDTTRATALALHQGVYVKSGATTRRYLGSFRTTGTSGQTEDSKAKRYVYNYANRVKRLMNAYDSTSTWTYSTATYRQANNNSANQIECVIGVAEDSVSANLVASVANSTATSRTVSVGIGLDSTTAAADRALGFGTVGTGDNGCYAFFEAVIPAGRHYLAWLEQGNASDTQTWRGTTYRGLSGFVFA